MCKYCHFYITFSSIKLHNLLNHYFDNTIGVGNMQLIFVTLKIVYESMQCSDFIYS